MFSWFFVDSGRNHKEGKEGYVMIEKPKPPREDVANATLEDEVDALQAFFDRWELELEKGKRDFFEDLAREEDFKP